MATCSCRTSQAAPRAITVSTNTGRDDTAYVESFLEAGRRVPAGEYYCPDGVTLPGDYVERAVAAGREPDAPDGGFALSEGPEYARFNTRDGGYAILSGYAASGRTWVLGRTPTMTYGFEIGADSGTGIEMTGCTAISNGQPHRPGQQPAASNLCGATYGVGLPDGPYGRCNLPAGHDGDWHQEWRDAGLWAEWRGPRPGERCTVCGRDGGEH